MSGILSPSDYRETLDDYLKSQSEQALYQASLLSQTCLEGGLGPEDIIALHFESLDAVLAGLGPRELARAHADGQQFLLEVMIAYGVKYKEYLELKLIEAQRSADARAAREQERALEAERLRHEREELLGVIAHELRTPITAARGHLDLAVRAIANGRLEPLPTYLGSAREALNRLSRLSADLVEASRGELPNIEFATLDIVTVVSQACEWARATAASKQIELEHQVPSTRILVRGSADGLLSVFGNLLSNAVRYTPVGGRVRIDYGSDDKWLWVTVQDSGIGMNPETQARIFEKFYRAPNARRVETRGLGLGLALVQQLVDAHGGAVDVESILGQGSTFRVRLPFNPAFDEADTSEESRA